LEKLPNLSKRELQVMKILWKFENASVREVCELFPANVNLAKTTIRTVMDRMVSKGYLNRKNKHGILVYSPILSKPLVYTRPILTLLNDLLEIDRKQVFEILEANSIFNPKEMKEIENILNNHDCNGEF
jgi:BlaI family transcriptional regulator, penicillinase repressor